MAARPWALPASTMPVVFGTLAAAATGAAPLHAGRFAAALAAMVALHSGANMLNDVYDHRRGLDTRVEPGCGAIVRGWLTARAVFWGALAWMVFGCGLGLGLTVVAGPALLWIGVAGVALGVAYSAPPLALKCRALGEPAVFLIFGVLGCLGAWVVQTGRVAWTPVAWSVPLALLVAAILHANNWRDLAGDRAGNITTCAGLLGDRGAHRYYLALIFGPFLVVAGLVALGWTRPGNSLGMPPLMMLSWLALPLAWRCRTRAAQRAAPRQPMDFLTLDAATAQLSLGFGILGSAALALEAWLLR